MPSRRETPLWMAGVIVGAAAFVAALVVFKAPALHAVGYGVVVGSIRTAIEWGRARRDP